MEVVMVPAPLPAELGAQDQSRLAVCGPLDAPPPPPDPPYQPWLRGAALAVLVRQGPDPMLPARRKRPRYLFRHPRRQRLEQLLVLKLCLFPFAVGPGPVEPKRTVKLPVIGRGNNVSTESLRALEHVSDDLSPEEIDEILSSVRKPRTRAECADGIRPCPWVSCRHHLFLDAHPTSGSIRLNHPGLEVDQIPESCSLDVADRVADSRTGSASLSVVAKLMGITHERVRQVETEAQERFAAAEAQHRRWAPVRQIVRKTTPT
jgi:hypothetical protein